MVKERKKLGNDQTLGPDITNFLQEGKMISDNMAAGKATLGAISKTKGPGKHFGDE